MATNYPFIKPSSDIEYLLADVYLSYEDPADYDTSATECATGALKPLLPPYRVAWFYYSGAEYANNQPKWVDAPNNESEILIVDRKGSVVFDSTKATVFHKDTSWHPTKAVYEWIYDQNVCRVVMHTAWPATGLHPEPRYYRKHTTPENGTLDPVTVTKQPKRLKSFIVGLNTLQKQRVIEFENGFNTELTVPGTVQDDLDATGIASGQVDGGRSGWRIELAADAGSGIGRADGCVSSNLFVQKINFVPPNDQGDFFLRPEGCYHFSRNYTRDADGRTVMTDPNHITLHNSCRPCCDCYEYNLISSMIYKVFQDWKKLGLQLNEVTRMLREAAKVVDKHNAAADDKKSNLVVTPLNHGHISVSWSYRNTGKRPTGIISVSLDWETRRGETEILDSTGYPATQFKVKSDTVKIKGNSFEQPVNIDAFRQGDGNHYMETGPLAFKFEAVQPGEVVSVSFNLFTFAVTGLTGIHDIPDSGHNEMGHHQGLSCKVTATGAGGTLTKSARILPWKRY